MFDEPSSYLDVKQRLKAALAIRTLIDPDKYIIVVEHDLSVLDYLSDFICCLYGIPGAYGVVTMPFSVREGNVIFVYNTDSLSSVNRIGGVMVSVFASGAVDRGFESWSGQSKDYKTGIFDSPLSTQH